MMRKTLVLAIVAMIYVGSAFAEEPNSSNGPPTIVTCYAYTCNNTRMCHACFTDGTCTDFPISSDQECVEGVSEQCGSVIDNWSFNHIHQAWDWKLGTQASGCATCGGGKASSPQVMSFGLRRSHRFRDITEPSSFGPGVFQNFDITLSLMRNGGANRARVFHPGLLGPLYLDDGLNFNNNGDTKDGVYVDSYRNIAQELRLKDVNGQLTTDIYQGTNAVLKSYDGKQFFFDVFTLGSPTQQSVPGTTVWKHSDIGAVSAPGDASFGTSQDLTIVGSGNDIWNNADGFRYVYQQVSGDFNIVGRVSSVQNTDNWSKAGFMIRQSTAADSIHAMVVATSGNGYAFQRRTVAGGSSDHTAGGGTMFPNSWLRLSRTGNLVRAYRSFDAAQIGNSAWQEIGSVQLSTSDPVLVGMCVTAHNDGALCTAEFKNVVLTASGAGTSWQSQDIGTSTSGSTTDLGTQNAFTMSASGSDLWNSFDEGHFIYQALHGDGSLTVRLAGQVRTDSWAKAGVAFRESLASDSKFAYMLLSSDNGTAFQRRTATQTDAIHTAGPAGVMPQWLRIVRAGDVFMGYSSVDGTNWTQVGSETISMGQDIYVGMLGTAHHDLALSTSIYDSVVLDGTATPANSWPATGLNDFRSGRLTKISDRNGYSVTLTYKYNPSNPSDQAAIVASPERQWQLDTITDAEGRQLKYTYSNTQVSGRWVVSNIALPNAQSVSYQYANGQLSQVNHADGTVSTFSASYDSVSNCTVMHYDDAADEDTHRRKDAYLSNNFQLQVADHLNDIPFVWNSSSLLIRMIIKNSEVVYMNMFDQNDSSKVKIYSEGTVREMSDWVRQVRYLKDGWTYTPASGYASFQGTLEDTFYSEPQGDYYQNYIRHCPATTTSNTGVIKQFTYTGANKFNTVTYSDGTTEQYSYGPYALATRYKDRLNRVTKYSYDSLGNMLTKEVGILFDGANDVNQAEHAIYAWEYYSALDPNQFLLKTAFDADYDPNHPDIHRTDYLYNNNHQLVMTTEGADVPGGQRAQLVLTYDSTGRLATSADALNRTTAYEYDLRDRIAKITYSDGSTERFIYGSGVDVNLLVKQKDRNGNVKKFEYDNFGRCIKTISAYAKMDLSDNETLIADPLVKDVEVCTFVTGTNLKASCLRAGDLTEYSYDFRNRLKNIIVHPRTGISLTKTNVFMNNLLFSIQDPYGRTTYNNYRASDSTLIRKVRGTIPAFMLADFNAVAGVNRDFTSNASYVVEDLEVDAAQQTTARIDGRNVRHAVTYDSRGRVIQTIEAESIAGVATSVQAKTQFEYDANSNRTRIKNPRTFTENSNFYTEFIYTGRNLLASQIDAAGKPESATTSYTYFLDKRLADTTDGRGFVWRQTYKECCGRLATKADPQLSPTGPQPVTYFGYDYFGNTTHTARLSDISGVPDCCTGNLDSTKILNETTTKFDARNRAIAQTIWLDPIGQVDENDPPIFGDPGAPAGKTGLTTKWRYDDDLTDNVGISADYTGLNLGVNNDGRAVEVTNPAGEKTVTVYDGVGRVIRNIDGNLNKITTNYDAAVGNLVETSVADGLAHETKTRTDGAGRVRETEDSEARVTTYEYDASSNRVKFRDPNATGQDCVFDERNREKQCSDTATPAPSVTKKEFDAASNVVKTTDALNKDTIFTFDARNRKISCADRLSGLTSYTYDSNNNLLTIIDADANASASGKQTVYTYDHRNLLATEAFPDHSLPTVNDLRAYVFDGANRLVSRLDQNNETTVYNYDMANRLSSRVYPDALNDTFTFDAASRLTSATCARYNNTVARNYTAGGEQAGRLKTETQTIGGVPYTVSYGYDVANRQTSVTYPSGALVSRSFTDRNQLEQVTLNASNLAQRTYDNGMRLATTTYGNGLVETRTYRADNLNDTIKVPGVTDFTYSWDANKRKTVEQDGVVPPVNSQTFGYNDENRLVSFNRQNGDSQTWNLSLVGDWNSFNNNGNLETRTHNSVHELTAVGPTALLYDSKGNLTTSSNGQTYQWDFENRMKQVTIPANPNPLAATYAFDALGRRVSNTFNGVTTVFVNDGLQEIAQYESGTLTREFVFGSYIDEPMMMLAGTTKTYFHTNNLYSVAALTDAAGAVVERYTYSPYGAVKILAPDGITVRNSSAVGNPWTFTGRRLDGETGLMYYRTRTYDVALGRFLDRMPWGAMGGRVNSAALLPSLTVLQYSGWRKLLFDTLANSTGNYTDRRYSLYDFEFQSPTNYVEPFSDPVTGTVVVGIGIEEVIGWGLAYWAATRNIPEVRVRPEIYIPEPPTSPEWTDDPNAPKEPSKKPQSKPQPIIDVPPPLSPNPPQPPGPKPKCGKWRLVCCVYVTGNVPEPDFAEVQVPCSTDASAFECCASLGGVSRYFPFLMPEHPGYDPNNTNKRFSPWILTGWYEGPCETKKRGQHMEP